MPVYLSDMKTVNQLLAMSAHEIIADHAQLDIRLDLKEVEVTAYWRELLNLVNEFKDAHRIDDAQRILSILQTVRREVIERIDQMEADKK